MCSNVEALSISVTPGTMGADPFQMAADLKSARESLTNSLANLDIMLGLIEQIENL
jgi:hypothetical protein